MPQLSERARGHVQEGVTFVKWLLYSCLIGVVVGLVAVAFHLGIDLAAELRGEHPNIIWLLPLGGMAIVLLYRVCGMEKDRGTNLVLVAVRDAERLKLRTAPLIFLSTILTHLVGGSAGREGAALQLGASLSAYAGRKLGLDELDGRIVVMCGMAAAFSALFGTPLTAAVFAMEVVTVGRMYYAAMVPCLLSSYTAALVAHGFGLHAIHGYPVHDALELELTPILQTAALGVLCALLSILFCKAMHAAPRLYARYLPDPLARAAAGGALVLALTLAIGSQTYNGAGDGVIRQLLAGDTIPEAFLLKILFTALTLGAGFRGGEIVPVLFTGCAFGTWAGPLLGLPHGFSGALGMAAVFCGATNCPLSSILLAFELFGGQGLPLYALCCGVAYMLSGYHGLYSEQKIIYSKFRPEWIDKKAE
ncbi:MAG: chloride channel protein [Lawsonibacter sp.]|jgi:H+/Cl- antiporter ClcA|nr:chloride channel protein [Lawsonibacter sp.]MCI9027355.1 chloride channel protein [Lawsonibacter sp.]MCI9656728.1 chloride channel protein [Lawsonibacter sp.]